MSSHPPRKVETVVIGAGLSGLTAARELQQDGREVVVLEKSRGLGGRCATRRWDGVRMDHGAQYFTAKSLEFARQVSQWLAHDVAQIWTHRLHSWQEGELFFDQERQARPHYVCRDGMHQLGKFIAKDLDIQLETKVRAVQLAGDSWEVFVENQERPWQASRVIATAPMPQMVDWFQEASGELQETLHRINKLIKMQPCLALMLHCPGLNPEWAGIHVEDDTVRWIGHDSSKRPSESEGRFVVHASPEFSQRWQDDDWKQAEGIMREKIAAITDGLLAAPTASQMHRWRYARVAKAHLSGAVRAWQNPPLVLAGDGHHSGRVSGAWLSGLSAAEELSWPHERIAM